jgi:hypothetical protein
VAHIEQSHGEQITMKKLGTVLLISVLLSASPLAQAQLVIEKPGYEIINTFLLPENLDSSLGDMLFSRDGKTVFIIDESESADAAVSAAAVNRNERGTVISFGEFREVFAFPNMDTGLVYGPGTETLFFNLDGPKMGQRLTDGTIEITDITGYNARYGGLDFVPAMYPNGGNIVTTAYSENYLLYQHEVTPDGDGSFTVDGAGKLYADFTASGNDNVGDLMFITSGPMAGNVMVALYTAETDYSLVYFPVGSDGLPPGGPAVTPHVFASGSTGAWGVTMDPVTGNFWMVDYDEVGDVVMTQIGEIGQNRLENISTRADIGTGADIAIAGFIIAGSENKCVVVRGRGPSMNVNNVPLLMDPNLTLYSGQTIIHANDDWMDQANPGDELMIEDLGLAPMDFRESAIYKCLPEGPYTALLRGRSGGTGVGIVEVFDADSGSAILENISTRARVGNGPLVTIAGFIIDGNTAKQVLVRGRGPTVGVPDGVTRLADPRLRLYQLLPDQSNVLLLENDNWTAAPNAASISATTLAPTDTRESAILMWLFPGVYTAILDGVFGLTGSGIVEVFDLQGYTGPGGYVADPLGDQPEDDLVSANVDVRNDRLYVTIRFDQGSFNPELTRANVSLDLDMDPATGHPGLNSGCTWDADLIGVDLFVSMSHKRGAAAWRSLGECNKFELVSRPIVTVLSDGFEFSMPLGDLNDDGNMTFKVTSSRFFPDSGASTPIRDIMPDLGKPPGTAESLTY